MTSKIYSAAELYEQAFSYRDIAAEVRFILDAYSQLTNRRAPGAAIEIACGPAMHAIEMPRSVQQVHVLDDEPAMLPLASSRAEGAGRPIYTHLADMRDSKLSPPVDLAFCMLDSLSHIHTDEDMIRHLAAVAQPTTPDAVYVIELGLPEAVHGKSSTLNHWSVGGEERILNVEWGNENDTFDQNTGMRRSRIEFRVDGAAPGEVIQDLMAFRMWTLDDMKRCLTDAHVWTCREAFGDFGGTDLFHEDAWRIILVLAKPG